MSASVSDPMVEVTGATAKTGVEIEKAWFGKFKEIMQG
jgi:hypothetical protein